jgi:hypothetical protein
VPKEVRDALLPNLELVQLELELQERRIELKRIYGHAFIKRSVRTEASEEYQ